MRHKLDPIDTKILTELQHDARLTIQELSDRVGLSATPCSRRIRHLEQEGIIKGFSARIDETMLGFGFAVFVSVRLDHQSADRLAIFEKAIELMPEVVDCWLMTGNRDYLLRVVLADLHEFESFMTGRLTKVEGVASLESSIPIRRVKEQLARLL